MVKSLETIKFSIIFSLQGIKLKSCYFVNLVSVSFLKMMNVVFCCSLLFSTCVVSESEDEDEIRTYMKVCTSLYYSVLKMNCICCYSTIVLQSLVSRHIIM